MGKIICYSILKRKDNISLWGIGQLHGGGDYREGLKRITVFQQKDMRVDRISVQETRMRKKNGSRKIGEYLKF